MSEAASGVRPRAQYLKQLPTLERRTAQGPAGEVVLELKLVRDEARYWLCTQGLAGPGSGSPKGYIVDYITPEYRQKGGGWALDERSAYGPSNTAWLQGNDYLQMLTDECERLQEEYERATNWQTKQRLEVTQEEMRQVIAQLDAIVLKKQVQQPR